MRGAFVSRRKKGGGGQANLPHFLVEMYRVTQKKSALEDYREMIDKIVLKESKNLGYRDYRGEYDNLPPFKNNSGTKRRNEMLDRYSGLRDNAAAAVKNYVKSGQARKRKRNPIRARNTRNRLSTGLCEICNIRMTKPEHEGFQPWHGETLEHIREHDLGGTLELNQVAVICDGCNRTLADMKVKVAGLAGDIRGTKNKAALYDYIIFKQVMLLSLKAAARDFNDAYIMFWDTRRDLSNRSHAKMIDSLEEEDRDSYRQTVYWTLDCRFHSHCRECGVCHSTIQSHHHGHNLAYVPHNLAYIPNN
tara:strand:+ start:81 stop:995 length:915 start_codon:yes stop_codon:yes gene_type:complete